MNTALELASTNNFVDYFNTFVNNTNTLLDKILFFKIYGFPFLILIAILAFIACNFLFNFVSIRLFKHSIDVVRGKYTSLDDPGSITHSQAIFTAALSTVGLGSVAGVAFAITIGGPGSIFWIMFAGWLGMSAKFAEVTLGHKYRTFKEDGLISGGPFLYMRKGMAEVGWKKIGATLGAIYAVTMMLTSFGAANMFQTNQAALVISSDFPLLASHPTLITLIIVVPIAIVVLGNAKSIAKLAGSVVPFMTVFYIVASIIVLTVNYKNLIPSLMLIIKDAFAPQAFVGGVVGSMVAGFSRAVFATESGGGTAAIAHAPSKTKEPIREGTTVFLEVILALTVCLMTGLVIVATNVHQDIDCAKGVLLTKAAFKTVHPYFAVVLTIAVYFLAVTTVMGWGYFGTMACLYVFGNKGVIFYKIIFLLVAWCGAATGEADHVIKLCDYIWAIVMLPNLFCVLFMSPMIRNDLKSYVDRYKAGSFKANFK
ncbi:alanine or glycine:cation symporter, AGCS family [Candidatus Xenohaliotis californiensis]|uniref:Alanine or glycine:cation symporter, AGCS family n=1 Tax=Candidatus Xenohaliotis californiensis TaxID=84677 RepID=A0ABM9N982_9RICK|nr:alanine or glycine:cation symporter, AGCS family [Candidatus Xenohaliotis californiensis]